MAERMLIKYVGLSHRRLLSKEDIQTLTGAESDVAIDCARNESCSVTIGVGNKLLEVSPGEWQLEGHVFTGEEEGSTEPKTAKKKAAKPSQEEPDEG